MKFDDKWRMQWLNTSPLQVPLSEGKLGLLIDLRDLEEIFVIMIMTRIQHRYKYNYSLCPGMAWLVSYVFIGLSVSYTYIDN